MRKPFWRSRTYLANVLFPILIYYWAPARELFVNNPEAIAGFWTVVNLILRSLTKSKVTLLP